MAITFKPKAEAPASEPIKVYNLLSIKDVSKQSGLGLGTLRTLLRESRMPPPRYLSKSRVWDQADISAWLESNLSDKPVQTNLNTI